MNVYFCCRALRISPVSNASLPRKSSNLGGFIRLPFMFSRCQPSCIVNLEVEV